jgi:hypothetical protein
MDPKTIGIGTIAIAALVVAVAKPGTETKTMVAATASETDKEVTDILKASPEVKPVTCKRQWLKLDGKSEIAWLCSDVGYDPARQTVLDKRAGAEGIEVSYTPDESKPDAVSVNIKVTTGTVAPEVIPKPDPIPEPPKEVGAGEAGVVP